MQEAYSSVTILLMVLCAALCTYLLWSVRRYSSLEQKEAKTQQILEIAVSELQHRVRNNLQVVGSLLDLQHIEIAQRGSENAVENIAYRVRAVSSAQDFSLSQKSNQIPALDLARRVVSIHFAQAAVNEYSTKPTLLQPKQATALALILNEALMNLKRRGSAEVQVQVVTSDSETRVVITMPSAQSSVRGELLDELSLEIIRTLVKHDLLGTCRVDGEKGTLEISFPQISVPSEKPLDLKRQTPPKVRKREALTKEVRFRGRIQHAED